MLEELQEAKTESGMMDLVLRQRVSQGQRRSWRVECGLSTRPGGAVWTAEKGKDRTGSSFDGSLLAFF